MRGKFFNFLAASSLLLSLMTTVFWFRSLSHTDQFGRWQRIEKQNMFAEDSYGVVSQGGGMIVVWLSLDPHLFAAEA